MRRLRLLSLPGPRRGREVLPVLLVLTALIAGVGSAQAQSRQVTSPDGGIVVTVQTGGDRLTYAVRHDGRPIVEQNKWSDRPPEHNVTIPFTRMLAGPIDYTPGAMVNAQPENFAARFERPMSQGTRGHQLAMYVVYESPLQMLADSPSQYRDNPQSMNFPAAVPTTWHETRALQAAIGDHVVVARRHDATWYLGAMSDGTARTVTVDLSFLDAGTTYEMTTWADGPNADRFAEDLQTDTQEVTAGDTVTIEMAPGGGFAARLVAAE